MIDFHARLSTCHTHRELIPHTSTIDSWTAIEPILAHLSILKLICPISERQDFLQVAHTLQDRFVKNWHSTGSMKLIQC